MEAVRIGGSVGHEHQSTLADYMSVLRRRKWIILLVLLIGVASTVYFSRHQARRYGASATVLLNPDASLVNGAGKTAADAQARFAASEAAVAHTPAVASDAIKRAGLGRHVTPDALVAASSVSSDPTSNLLTFTVSSARRDQAVRLVNGYVQAFAAYSAQQSTSRIEAAIASESAQINKITRSIATARKAHQSAAALYAQLRSLLNQRSQDKAALTSVTASGGAQVARLAQGARQTQPDVRKELLIGITLSLILGIALSSLRETFDHRVHSPDEVIAALGEPTLLGWLPTPPRSLASKGKLVMTSGTHPLHEQQFHKLRVALDFANLQSKCITIMVTSAVEQEGKTTTSANLAIALALAGRRVTLIDLDLRRAALWKIFNVPDRPGITDVALGSASVGDVLKPIIVGADTSIHPRSNGHSAIAGPGRCPLLRPARSHRIQRGSSNPPRLTMPSERSETFRTLLSSTVLRCFRSRTAWFSREGSTV